MKKVYLRKHGERKAQGGYQWIFSNLIDRTEENIENGDIVLVYTSNNTFFGKAFYNKNSLIALRLLTFKDEPIDKAFFTNRILSAHRLRENLYPGESIYRMVFSESDLLPGLIIDKFEDTFSIQINSIGMEKQMPLIVEILKELFNPKCIIEKNESPLRLLEGLEQKSGILYGKDELKEIVIDDIRYQLDVLAGQKSGFFLDQRENRKVIRKYLKGKNVLDCFCNEGGFALNAARGGAKEVTGLDISKNVIEKCGINSKLNGFDSICKFEVKDVFDALEEYVNEKKQFDAVIIDPPSFTKSKKNIPTARKAYKKINSLAINLIKDEGYLISSSCSHHIDENEFLNILYEAAVRSNTHLQLLEFHSAAPDHPILISMPETKYLKFGVFFVKKF
jgi:23S rRNA (cytosine1962-C5)-methyltransferase